MTDRPPEFTVRTYRSALEFREDHPDYAAAAREFIRDRPDVRSLKFVGAWVRQIPHNREGGGGIARVTIELKSPTRLVWVEVRQVGDRWNVEAVLDREQ